VSSDSSLSYLSTEINGAVSAASTEINNLVGAARTEINVIASTAEELGSEVVNAFAQLGAAVRSTIQDWGGVFLNDLGDLDPPAWIKDALKSCGMEWPGTKGSTVRSLANYVRQVASIVEDGSHQATVACEACSQVVKSRSGQSLLGGWLTMKGVHFDGLVAGCRSLATALDYTSESIPVLKAAALYEIGMATVTGAGLVVATVLSDGAAAAVDAAVEAACIRFVQSQVAALVARIISEVIEPRLKPAVQQLIARVEAMAKELGWGKIAETAKKYGAEVESYLKNEAETLTGLEIDPIAAKDALQKIETLAQTVREGIATVRAGLHTLQFA